MLFTEEMKTMTTEELNEFYLMRKKAGLAIDPLTAEVFWSYAHTIDPYGIDPNLPEEYQQIGRQYFARSPEGEIWVWFGDLPEETRDELWTMHNRQLAFPAGLDCISPAGE
jgi:hypothetical protein